MGYEGERISSVLLRGWVIWGHMKGGGYVSGVDVGLV